MADLVAAFDGGAGQGVFEAAKFQIDVRKSPIPRFDLLKLDNPWAMMLPVSPGRVPKVSFKVDVAESTTLRLELRTSSRATNHTPDVTLGAKTFNLKAGSNQVIGTGGGGSLHQLEG